MSHPPPLGRLKIQYQPGGSELLPGPPRDLESRFQLLNKLPTSAPAVGEYSLVYETALAPTSRYKEQSIDQ